ncbi:MAG: ribosome recycling factor [Endomicrobiia bacterium]|nr:ribosome recycling factor [Endomicrobiia bacterium]
MDTKQVITHCEELMKKTVEKFRADLGQVRTGRASASILDAVKVESYGSLMSINQLASVSIPEARTIEIRPWDVSQISAIEKAILKSDIGITPQNDGKAIRLSLPPLTQERRAELVKSAHKLAEDFRVAVRNERRDAIEKSKKLEKDNSLAEDARKKLDSDIQKLTDAYIKKIDEFLAVKEKEIKD